MNKPATNDLPLPSRWQSERLYGVLIPTACYAVRDTPAPQPVEVNPRRLRNDWSTITLADLELVRKLGR